MHSCKRPPLAYSLPARRRVRVISFSVHCPGNTCGGTKSLVYVDLLTPSPSTEERPWHHHIEPGLSLRAGSSMSNKRHSYRGEFLHCVRIACILRTHRLGYSPKNTSHLSSSTAKHQSPHENNETALNLVINCRYEQANQPCKVQLCKGMQDAHMFKWQVPHSDISPRRWPHNWQQTPS